MIIKAIEKSFSEAKRKGWDKTFWAIDIHGTIIKPNYQAGNIPKEFYPFAKETLQLISKRSDVCLILYTCSHPWEIVEYNKMFSENEINFKYVNENPEVETDPQGYGNYEKKMYFNVLFEDKAGFDPADWQRIYNFLETK
jgi:hypothetical protein